MIKLGRGSTQTYDDCSILSLVRRLGFFTNFLGRSRSGLNQISMKNKSIKCSFVLNCFYFALGSKSTERSAQTYEK